MVDPRLEKRRLLRVPCLTARPALFLDRDGVLIEDKHHLSNPNDVVLCPGAKALVRQAGQAGWPVVIITNQSGIARGYFDWAAYEQVTDRILEILGTAAPLAAIYANGYSIDAPLCSWRKPSPAMLLAAALDLKLDLNRSLLVGDRLSDLMAGAGAGLHWLGHVQTGHGQQERNKVMEWHQQNERVSTGTAAIKLKLLRNLCDFPLELLSPFEQAFENSID